MAGTPKTTTTTTKPAPALDPAIAAILQSIGGDAGGVDPNDPVLLVGREPAKAYGVRLSAPDKQNVAKQKTVSEVTRDLFRMRDREQVKKLQQRLYLGGFYDQGVRASDLTGDQDENTVQALERAAIRAARFLDADEDVTLDEVIDRAAQDREAEEERRRAAAVIRLPNPDDIRDGADKVAQATLGRKATDAEIAEIVAGFQSKVAAEQQSAYGMAESGGTVTEAPSLASFVESKLRAANPVESRTMDEVEVGNEFFDLLRGGS